MTIVTHLLGVGVAVDAARILAEKGIEAEIVDLVCLYPMDTGTIVASVAKTGRPREKAPARSGMPQVKG